MSNPSFPVTLAQTEQWLAIDKPAGIVVHDVPGEKHAGNTIVDWLRSEIPAISQNFSVDDSRPGIVHRLDADTSGVLLVAKDPTTLATLQNQFRDRSTKKTYQALVLGDTGTEGIFTGAIGRVGEDTRHAIRRLSFSWEKDQPKPAETEWQRFKILHDRDGRTYTLVELRPKTGRTHQLRVQLLDYGTPIIGDPMYSTKESRAASADLGLNRQFLHAISLTFTDPATQQPITVESPLAQDLQHILALLE